MRSFDNPVELATRDGPIGDLRASRGGPPVVGNYVGLYVQPADPNDAGRDNVLAEVTSVHGDVFRGEVANNLTETMTPPSLLRMGSPVEFTMQQVILIAEGPGCFPSEIGGF